MEDREKRIEKLARETLTLARNTLLVHLRFLDMALSMQTLLSVPGGACIATDGEFLFYDARFVLGRFKESRGRVARDYLHTVLHCVFRHMFVGPAIDRRRWNLACDIAIENTINELGLNALQIAEVAAQQQETAALLASVEGLTAERIYRFLLDTPISEIDLQALECLFASDSHDVWYQREKYAAAIRAAGYGTPEERSKDGERGEDGKGTEGEATLEDAWKRVSERLQEDLETFSKQYGDKAGNLTQNLRELNRERYDYGAFLRKFAVPTEVMRVNDEEFDYIFYTYGLAQYENMPLVEPLEYKDEKRIREFVVAIDTSGSVSGELVQSFIQKTYNIIKSTESFAARINLHVIQCDAEVQEDAKITSQEEFDEYLRHMKIRGLGGTDFCPVFEYVEQLCERGEFENLSGLIYFTDGYGRFPAQMPPYPTAFVFIDEGFNQLEVPSWAIKLVLRKDEI